MLTWDDIERKIDAFVEQYPRSSWGPAHIVIEDYNLYDEDIEFSLRWIDAVLAHRQGDDSLVDAKLIETMKQLDWYDDYETSELQATRDFLNELLLLSESVRIEYHGDWRNEEEDSTTPEDTNLVEMKGIDFEKGIDPIFLWTEVWRGFFDENEEENEGD